MNLQTKIINLANTECERAAVLHGPTFNSLHEAFAVIQEEFEEAMDQTDIFDGHREYFWSNVKANKIPEARGRLDAMYEFACYAAAEWIQVAAMCHKAMMTRQKEGGDA